MSTSFIQYQRCDLCQTNHNKPKKHVFSKRHQTVLQNIMSKFTKKVEEAKHHLQQPEIKDRAWENGAQFWCYFCKQEQDKHWTVDNVTVKHGGLLQHLAEPDHLQNSEQFWKDNRLDREKRKQFTLSDKDIEEFKVKCEVAIQTYIKLQNEHIQKAAFKQATQETQRQLVAWHHTHMLKQGKAAGTLMQRSARDIDTSYQDPLQKLERVRTVAAKADGLTCISLKGVNDKEGNIHTGALPPWLRKDDGASNLNSNVIGPTMEVYQKHLAQKKKSKLPANRVGAKFDHKGETPANWLPSFGRVWNKNRKSHVRDLYMKSMSPHASSQKNLQGLPTTTTAAAPATLASPQQPTSMDAHPGQETEPLSHIAHSSTAVSSVSKPYESNRKATKRPCASAVSGSYDFMHSASAGWSSSSVTNNGGMGHCAYNGETEKPRDTTVDKQWSAGYQRVKISGANTPVHDFSSGYKRQKTHDHKDKPPERIKVASNLL